MANQLPDFGSSSPSIYVHPKTVKKEPVVTQGAGSGEGKPPTGGGATTTTNPPAQKFAPYEQWVIDKLGSATTAAKNAAQSAYESFKPPSTPMELNPRSLSQAGTDALNAGVTWGNAFTGNLAPAALQAAGDAGWVSPETVAEGHKRIADAYAGTGSMGPVLSTLGYVAGPGKILGPLAKGVARVAPAAAALEGGLSSAWGAYGQGKSWPEILHAGETGAGWGVGGQQVAKRVVAPVVKGVTKLFGGSTPQNFVPPSGPGRAPSGRAAPKEAPAAAAPAAELTGQQAADYLAGQRGTMSDDDYKAAWSQLVKTGKITPAGASPQAAAPAPQPAPAPAPAPAASTARERASALGQWYDMPPAEVQKQATASLSQPNWTPDQRTAIQGIAGSGGEGSALTRKAISIPVGLGAGMLTGRHMPGWGEVVGLGSEALTDALAKRISGGGPAAMRQAIEDSYPALVGSAPDTVANSQAAQRALQQLIFSQGLAGQQPGMPTMPSLSSLWGGGS